MVTEHFEDEYQSLIDNIESLENEELWSQRVIDEQDDD
jgi:hypothetical protein